MTKDNGIKHEPLRSDDGDYDDPVHANSINHPHNPTQTPKFTIIDQEENEMESMETMENDGSCHLPPKTNIPLLTAALLASGTTGGTTYAFGLYASALKATLHLSQKELDTISATFFCAGLFSWIPGLAVDSFGPRLSLGSGGILGAIALLSYWSVAVEILPIPRSAIVPVLSFLGVITFLSSSLVTGSVFKIVSGCCEQGRSKGAAVGAAKGYVGLGAGAYACLFRNVRGEGWSDLNFLVMAAVFAVLACTLPAVFLLDKETAAVIGKSGSSGGSKSRGRNGSRSNLGVLDVTTGLHFRIIYSGLLLLGAIVVGTSLLSLYSESKSDADIDSERQSQSSNSHRNYVVAFIIATVWFGPILLMLKLPTSANTPLPSNDDETWLGEDDADDHDNQFELVQSNLSRKDITNSMTDGEDDDQDKIEQHHLIHQQTNQSQSQSNSQQQPSSQTQPQNQPSKSQTPKSSKSSTSKTIPKTEYTTLQMLQTPQALLLFWTTTIIAGGGTVMTNNMGQMAEALYFPPVVSSASVAIFSAAQAAARVIAGSLSEIALRRWKLPRPTFFVVASVASVASHFLLAFARTEAMFVFAVAQSGVAFGAIWPLMVLVVGEIFGMDNMASNYMFYDGGTSAVGTLVLSKFVAQWVYERHVVEEDGDGIDIGVDVQVDESDSESMGYYSFVTDDNFESQDAFAGGGGIVAGGEGGGAVGGDGLNCFGPECFELTHQIVAILSVTCVVSSVALMYITKDNYARER